MASADPYKKAVTVMDVANDIANMFSDLSYMNNQNWTGQMILDGGRLNVLVSNDENTNRCLTASEINSVRSGHVINDTYVNYQGITCPVYHFNEYILGCLDRNEPKKIAIQERYYVEPLYMSAFGFNTDGVIDADISGTYYYSFRGGLNTIIHHFGEELEQFVLLYNDSEGDYSWASAMVTIEAYPNEYWGTDANAYEYTYLKLSSLDGSYVKKIQYDGLIEYEFDMVPHGKQLRLEIIPEIGGIPLTKTIYVDVQYQVRPYDIFYQITSTEKLPCDIQISIVFYNTYWDGDYIFEDMYDVTLEAGKTDHEYGYWDYVPDENDADYGSGGIGEIIIQDEYGVYNGAEQVVYYSGDGIGTMIRIRRSTM